MGYFLDESSLQSLNLVTQMHHELPGLKGTRNAAVDSTQIRSLLRQTQTHQAPQSEKNTLRV